MARRISAFYRDRAVADEAAARLRGAGFASANVSIAEQGAAAESQAGVFDRLATMLVPKGSPREHGFVVCVDAESDRIDAAALALESGAERVEIAAPERLTERVIEFSETAEQLVVEKQPVVREEIVMQVQAREHIQHVHETVRRTEVEIERFGPDEASRGS